MKNRRFGFTLIEVSLFLAVTGLIFVGILVGTQNALRDQRFFDSTQNFVEFLKTTYSQVANPQSAGNGRGELVIYGKLVVFGEKIGLNGEPVNNDNIQRIYTYDVVGETGSVGTGNIQSMLMALKANVVVPRMTDGKVVGLDPAGLVEDYSPRWDAQIETTATGDERKAYTGSILIVRHPNSGTINTLVSAEVIEVNEKINATNWSDYATLLTSKLSSFRNETVDFCVNPEGADRASDLRRNIRIVKDARNSSGVETIDLDSSENKCLK